MNVLKLLVKPSPVSLQKVPYQVSSSCQLKLTVRVLKSYPRVNRLCGDTYSYVCPQTWLNEARTNIGLFTTMFVLNENDSLAYFAYLGELSSGLSYTMGFFKTLSFHSLSPCITCVQYIGGCSVHRGVHNHVRFE